MSSRRRKSSEATDVVTSDGYNFVVHTAYSAGLKQTVVRFGIPRAPGGGALQHDLSCVTFSYDGGDAAELDWVGYGAGCSEPALSESAGTVAMLRRAVELVFERFPACGSINFTALWRGAGPEREGARPRGGPRARPRGAGAAAR